MTPKEMEIDQLATKAALDNPTPVHLELEAFIKQTPKETIESTKLKKPKKQ